MAAKERPGWLRHATVGYAMLGHGEHCSVTDHERGDDLGCPLSAFSSPGDNTSPLSALIMGYVMTTTKGTAMSNGVVLTDAGWDAGHGPAFGGPAGIDHFHLTVTARRWEDDGSIYAGRVYCYERRTINGVIDYAASYPATGHKLAAFEAAEAAAR
jgi:hypothetical protein